VSEGNISPAKAEKQLKAPLQKSTALVDAAHQYAKDGLYREAISAFKKYLIDNPKDQSALRGLGIVYVKSGSFKSGINCLAEAWSGFKEDLELNYYLAEAYRTQNRFSDAIYHYKQVLLTDPKNLATHKALTWSYYSIRYYAEALKSSRLLKKMAPDDFQVSIIQARIMNKIGLNDKALSVLSKSEALASPSELPFLYSAKGDILFDLGDLERAEQFFRKALQEQPLLPGALTGLAKILMKNPKNSDQAISYLERAIRIKPNHIEAIFLLAQSFETKDESKATELYRKFSKEAGFDPVFQRELHTAKNFLARFDKNDSQSGDVISRVEDLEDQL
jgi:tetratricopeptide (TPR) repeat protein